MLVVSLIFAGILFLVLAYFAAFEYSRYRIARMLADGLGGKAVYRINGSYMRRDHGMVEERAWVRPDDKMAWGRIQSIFRPPEAILFLQRRKDPGFKFNIEYKTNVLYRTISLDSLKDMEFNVPRLDEVLRLRADNHTEAAAYFLSREKEEALVALFLAEFIGLRANHGGIVATRKRITTDDVSPEKIDLYLKYLRAF